MWKSHLAHDNIHISGKTYLEEKTLLNQTCIESSRANARVTPLVLFRSYYQKDFPKPQNNCFKSYFPILLKYLFLEREVVFYREKLFWCFQNIWENLGKLNGHIFSIYNSLNKWSCLKYWTKPVKTLYAYFKLLKSFYKKYSQIIPRKF